MRWRALRDALRCLVGCHVHVLACNRRGQCRSLCRVTGRAPTAVRRLWYHNRTYCDAYADLLVDQLVSAGVATVVCGGLETYQYVLRLAKEDRLTVVFDMHNVESQLYSAIRTAAPAGSLPAILFSDQHLHRVRMAERSAALSATQTWCCTPQDQLLLRETYPEVPVGKLRVVPNVVEVPSSMPSPAGKPATHICFIGHFDHYPNVLAAHTLIDQIAPLISTTHSRLPVIVAGAKLSRHVGATDFSSNVRLVSDPPNALELLAGGILAVPLSIGGGSRLKVLEAFATGAPVISTAKGVQGLDVQPGVHYLPAESPTDFAAAITALIRDADLRTTLRTQAWRLVRARYSVEAVARRLSEVMSGWSMRPVPAGVVGTRAL
jgi:glycosyltransferase involved in cell wall biosynthesis